MFNEHLQVGSSDAVLIWAIFLFFGGWNWYQSLSLFYIYPKGFWGSLKFKTCLICKVRL